jgi:hypothetical protein
LVAVGLLPKKLLVLVRDLLVLVRERWRELLVRELWRELLVLMRKL